ncbi:hypothetical protein C5167_036093, partial [Papaver somniferum]
MAPLRNTGGAIIVAAAAISTAAILTYFLQNPRSKYYSSRKILPSKKKKKKNPSIHSTAFLKQLVANLRFCFEILAKAEFLNPGGSVKDRVAVKIIQE